MATVTVRDLPEDVVAQIKQAASAHGHSMEQEVRDVLSHRYGERAALVERIRQRWPGLPATTSEDIEAWRTNGRP